MPDVFEGITPRWTLFSNLLNPDEEKRQEALESKVLSVITVIDSAKEREIGYGTRFNYKKDIEA